MRLGFCCSVLVLAGTGVHGAVFSAAKPIWPTGRETERNLTVAFRAVFTPGAVRPVVLKLTASTIYRVSVNGRFAGYGPARGPHGYFRVDRWDISHLLEPAENTVTVAVAGYNVNSYYTIDAPSFLQAEVTAEGRVLAATGSDTVPFVAAVWTRRIQKVQRYSFQRPFSEAYRWTPEIDWSLPAACSPVTTRFGLLPRRVPYPRFTVRPVLTHVAHGTLKTGIGVAKPWKDRSLVNIGPKLGGYPEGELETVPSLELQTVANATYEKVGTPVGPDCRLQLAKGTYQIVDLGTNLSGFLGLTVTCTEPTRLFLTFDEILSKGDVDWKRLGCVNILSYELPSGQFELESFEAYTCRYVKLLALKGSCEVERIYLREYVNPNVWEAHFAASDSRLNRLFAAGRETYRQNAVDVFMDCPSRERAGWLCDSFFTARVAPDLGDTTAIERNLFENYLLPPSFEFLPPGMLPMCYPADHNDSVFIPNWSLWFVVQLEEYLARSGDRETVDALRGRVLKLFDYFKRFRNREGLLEKLESWVFVEWSAANRFVQDVNYPSNMLYAAALAAAGRIYKLSGLLDDAEAIRAAIRKQSFDGIFFVDNAVRREGRLQVTRNRSEVCQYFAFFFDIANPKTHAALWKVLCDDFGPKRKETKAHADVHVANAFIGNMLRLELLSRYGRCQQLLDESVAYLLYMAEETGTLWENVGAYASCNHGFASHIVHTLYRDVLGLYEVDTVKKRVKLRFTALNLDWCEGCRPTADGFVSLRWTKRENVLTYRLDVPAGYAVTVENKSAARLVRKP